MSAKTTQLRRMLDSGETEFILEAHNGLAARIVESRERDGTIHLTARRMG